MSESIVVIGSSNTDFIMKMDRLPRVGETVTDATFLQTYGGKGANQAVGAARAGGKVAFINCVGEDVFGRQCKENLRAAGIRVDTVYEEAGIASGTALVMIGPNGSNMLSVAPGANYRLTPARIDEAEGVITQAEMIVLQYEILPETLAHAIQIAARHDRKIMLNLAPARPLDEALLRSLFALIVNESEAEFLVGYAVDSPQTIQQAVQDLLARGPEWVIVTLGAQGCLAASADGQISVKAFEVKAVDTTAAGDIFCGSLATALVEGQTMEDALRFASAASAISVTRLGAQPSAPGRDEIDAFLAQHGGD